MVAQVSRSTRQPYAAFASHVSKPISDTNLVLRDAIRQAYPDLRITVIDQSSCDLRGWASNGDAVIVEVEDDENTLKRRKYSPPKSRLQLDDGTFEDLVTFAQYTCEYKGHSFRFILAEWIYNMWGSTKAYQYFLSPPSLVDGQDAKTVVDEIVAAATQWTAELHNEIYIYDQGEWVKNAKLWADVQRASWDDIILEPSLKQSIIADVNNFFDRRALYNTYGVPWKRGVILYGVPGCGKTATIKALMNMLGQRRPQHVESLYVKTLDACGRKPSACVGEIFALARARAPCLLIFEDIDSLVVDDVRSYFLNEVDGLEANDGIFMIGSTNHLERLDPGISKRPSRFDRRYHYATPNEQERTMYCDYWKKKLEANADVPFDPAIAGVVAKLTDGFSFAYLKELFIQSLFNLIEIKDGNESIADSKPVTDHDGDAKVTGELEEIEKIDIPEHLKDNLLMQVLMIHIKSLRQAIADVEKSDAEKKEAEVKTTKKKSYDSDE